MSFKLKITTNNKNVVTETGTPVVPENNNIINKINDSKISTGGGYTNPINEKRTVLKIGKVDLTYHPTDSKVELSTPPSDKKVVKIPKDYRKNTQNQYTKYIPSVNTIEPRVAELLKTKFNMTLDDIINNDDMMVYLKKYFIENADRFLERRHFLVENTKLKSMSEEQFEDFKVNKINKVLHSDKYKIIDTGIFTDFITNFVFFNAARFIEVLSEAIEEYGKPLQDTEPESEIKKEEPVEQPVKQEEPPKKLEMELSNSSPLANPTITQESATDITAERVNNGMVVKEKASDNDF